MPATIEGTDLDLIVLEDLDLDLTPKCDGYGCERDATHTITCACLKGTEFTCLPCYQAMVAAADEDPRNGIIIFEKEKSCGHTTYIFLCTLNPL